MYGAMKLEVMKMGINDGWQSTVQSKFAIDIYEQFWDGCEVIENDSLGETERTARILDFGDVDKIIKIKGTQIHLAQRFRKPYWNGSKWANPDFTLRYSRPISDNEIEYTRLMNAYENGAAAYPKRYSFGRVHNDHEKGLYELYIINTDSLIESIKSESIEEKGPISTNEGQKFTAYSIDEIKRNGCIVKEWNEESGIVSDQEQPNNPHDITNW